MFKEEIGNEFIVIQEGTSEGTQIKYRKDGFWYKKDNRGHEGRAEYLVSKFMEFTTLQENEFISYEEGTINGKSGCRSKNFLDEEEEENIDEKNIVFNGNRLVLDKAKTTDHCRNAE